MRSPKLHVVLKFCQGYLVQECAEIYQTDPCRLLTSVNFYFILPNVENVLLLK
jgi:hypothetical protein